MPPHTKAAGRAVKNQNTENARVAAAKAREIVNMPDGLMGGQVMRRKRGTISDESCIDNIIDLISEGSTVHDALQHAGVHRRDWYRWIKENHHGASDKYQDAALSFLELMADRTLKVFENLEAKREADKQVLRDKTSEWHAAHHQHEIKMREWRGQGERGEAPLYDGPSEPKYDGPEEWELGSAKEKAAMWKFRLQAGLTRFKKAEEHNVNISQNILHTIDVKNMPGPLGTSTGGRASEFRGVGAGLVARGAS
jgi:Bacteriophage Sf6, terminase small subunit-like